ncbi:unnamed protein product [Arctogadus glacialis]
MEPRRIPPDNTAVWKQRWTAVIRARYLPPHLPACLVFRVPRRVRPASGVLTAKQHDSLSEIAVKKKTKQTPFVTAGELVLASSICPLSEGRPPPPAGMGGTGRWVCCLDMEGHPPDAELPSGGPLSPQPSGKGQVYEARTSPPVVTNGFFFDRLSCCRAVNILEARLKTEGYQVEAIPSVVQLTRPRDWTPPITEEQGEALGGEGKGEGREDNLEKEENAEGSSHSREPTEERGNPTRTERLSCLRIHKAYRSLGWMSAIPKVKDPCCALHLFTPMEHRDSLETDFANDGVG